MKLPNPSSKYDYSVEAQRNSDIETAFRNCHQRDQDLEVIGGPRLVLSSPDGTRWKIEIDNVGTISAATL